MNRIATTVVLLGCTALAALAAPPAKRPDKYTVRVKTTGGLVAVAEVTRDPATGRVAAKGLVAPSVDRLAGELERQWASWKPPARITIQRTIASDTGMHPSYQTYSATFTPSDGLYQAAVIQAFADQFGYDVLGLSVVDFIIFDSSAEWPPNAHDRASTRSNFRKNPGRLAYTSTNHTDSMFVFKKVRDRRPPSSADRVSASDRNLAVPQSNDEGTFEVGWLELFPDGKIELHARRAREVVLNMFGTFVAEDTTVAVIDKGEYRNLPVAGTSPFALEAKLIRLEEAQHYDIVPAIDPAIFR